jgi:hypothetical protein
VNLPIQTNIINVGCYLIGMLSQSH